MEPVEILKAMFEIRFGSPPRQAVELSAQLGGSARRMLRLSDDTSSAIGVLYDVREENVAFVEFSNHFRRCGLPVPEIYAADLDQGAYLEEDLGDTTLFEFLEQHRSGQDVAPEVVAHYRAALNFLPQFQVVGARDLDYSVCYPRPDFDRQSIAWDLNYFKYCFLRPAGIRFNEQALEDDFARLTAFLLEADRNYFLYRDFQSRNIMVRENGLSFIDYQGGRRGALQYDVASLLYDAKANLSPTLREELLTAYLDALRSVVDLDPACFMEHYYAYAYVRIFQALGAYGFLGLIRGQPLFLESVPYALGNLEWLLTNIEVPVATPELAASLRRMVDSEALSAL